MRDLRAADVDIVTLGQYLQPTRRNLPVAEFVPPAQFDAYRDFGLSLGFKMVFSGPLVRSSYMADAVAAEIRSVNLILSLPSGVLLVLIFPNFNFTWLAPVALAPLLIACARETVLETSICSRMGLGIRVLVRRLLLDPVRARSARRHGAMGRMGHVRPVRGAQGTVYCDFRGAGRYRDAKTWAIPGAAALWTAVEYAHGTIGLAWIGWIRVARSG